MCDGGVVDVMSRWRAGRGGGDVRGESDDDVCDGDVE